MPYLTKIIDERSFKSKRFVLEHSVTDHVFVIKAVYRIPDEVRAKELFEKLITQRKPTDILSEAPAPKRGKNQTGGLNNER